MSSLSPKTPDICNEPFEAAVRAAENVLYDLTRPGTRIIGEMAREIAAAVLTAALSPAVAAERERCAQIAERIQELEDAALGIPAAIRNQTTNDEA